jgi:hypothetical protein
MYFICDDLHFALRVVGDPEEIESLLGEGSPQKNAVCPECPSTRRKVLQKGVFMDSELLTKVAPVLRELSPIEAHLALEGLGFPEERQCAAEIVRQVMRMPVKSVQARDIRGTSRTVIDSITYEDGTTLFMSGSGWGALVYRIRKPKPYVSKELV